MQTLEFERQPLGVVPLDFCFACQLIWFDSFESQQLTPGGVLEVFKSLSAHPPSAHRPLPAVLGCPRCGRRLSLTHDLQHTTRFTYFRCELGHGHLSPFFQFLLEKSFVRPVTGAELAALKARIRTIQCSNCGAAVDLERDAACPYCASPISILDPDAVAKTVTALDAAQQRRSTIDVEQLADALLMRPPPEEGRPHVAADLVAAGIAAIASLLVRK
jgi:DNA-directed RNA polymerase subunit RPC12/RpoP